MNLIVALGPTSNLLLILVPGANCVTKWIQIMSLPCHELTFFLFPDPGKHVINQSFFPTIYSALYMALVRRFVPVECVSI